MPKRAQSHSFYLDSMFYPVRGGYYPDPEGYLLSGPCLGTPSLIVWKAFIELGCLLNNGVKKVLEAYA